MSALALRWLKFNTVGGIGIAVQLAALAVFKSLLGLNYLLATGLAVETAVLHNFIWHERWTWRERTGGREGVMRRLARFHLGNGFVSILANLVLMRFFAGQLQMQYLVANALSISITALVNFVVSEAWVFRR